MRPVRQRITAPLAVIIAAPADDSKRRRRLPRKEFTLIVCLVVFFSANLLLQNNIVWIWRNRYVFVGCPEYSLWLRPHEQPSRVVHLTAKFGYKEDMYKGAVDNHVAKVMDSGVFTEEEIVSYSSFPSFIIDDPTWEEHLQFLYDPNHESSLGAGFWFWKPVIIHHQLEMMNDGDFLIYSDIDREDFVSWTPLLLETMVERHSDLALEQMSRRENEWTKGDIYDRLCPEILPYYDPNTQYTANFLAIRKNAETMALVSDWMEAAKNYHLISDERSTTLKYQKFRNNSHDQSLLSTLIRCSYDERGKQKFKWTCLGDWTAFTFRLHAEASTRHR